MKFSPTETKPDFDPESFAIQVQLFLELMDMTHRDLAFELQVSPSTVSRWASGDSVPKQSVQALVKKTFGKIWARDCE
jgi:ribosome-binding protein aMBF1 (putative translation factor)